MKFYDSDKQLGSIRLVASDMDCTLLADDGSMPQDMHKIIDSMHDAGMVFCAASGRPAYTLRSMFADCLDKIALMSDNGAWITFRGDTVYKSLMSHSDYHALIDYALADGRGFPVACGLDTCYIREHDREHDAHLRRFFTNITYVKDFKSLDTDINKVTVHFPLDEAEEVYAQSYRDKWGGKFHVTNAGKQWIDIMNKGINKGAGLQHLCNHLGIPLRDAAAFGDTYNDIQMLEAAGHGFVMSNAEEHMHAHADYLAPTNNERGVATVIHAILDAKTQPAV